MQKSFLYFRVNFVTRLSGLSRSPKFAKGALISFDPFSLIPQVIIFQYNPETLSRKIQSSSTQSEGGGSSEEVQRIKGPPTETIDLSIEIDAVDQLEKPDQNSTAVSMGIYPQISALEMMIYPKSASVIANTVLAAAGTIEVIPPEEPFTIFVWGKSRIVPARITSFDIKEISHDTDLNPIQAEISVNLQVLSYNNFKITHPGFALSLSHQIVKETMSTIGTINNISSLGEVKIL